MENIPYGLHHLNESDISEVVKVLRSDRLTQGPKIAQFERAVCEYTGAKYAVALSSGTAALHVSYLAAGLKKGDRIITTPITFVATSNAALYVGAIPVFADIDYETMELDAKEIEKKITPRTKIIVPVNFAGLPCDLSDIKRIAGRNSIIVIEDSCHALGATYRGSVVGSCKYSDMCVFSFHPVKHITTGEGGMVTTNSKALYNKMLALRSHGIYKRQADMKREGGWYYKMSDLGFNYRMTDIQAALGISQMRRLGTFLKRRDHIARLYNRLFKKMLGDSVKLPAIDFPDRTHAWHLYILRLNDSVSKVSRRELYEKLHFAGIGAQVHYIPVTSQPYYSRMGYKTSEFPAAKRFYKNAITLPLYPKMKDEDVLYVAKRVKDIICHK